MPLRLLIFFVLLAGGVFSLAYLNNVPYPVALSPGWVINLSAASLFTVGLLVGVVSVFLLYLYDVFADGLKRLKDKVTLSRGAKVEELYREAGDRLLLEDDRDGLRLLERALGIDKNHVPSLIALGRARRLDGRVSEAIELHSRAKAADPASVAALLELAEDYVADRQFANAIASLADLAADRIGSGRPRARMRDIYLAVGNVDEAVKAQQGVVDAAPSDRKKTERETLTGLLYEQARRRAEEGGFAAAADGYRQVLRNDPSFLPATLRLAELTDRQGRTEEALKTLERGFRRSGSPLLAKAMEGLLRARGEDDRGTSQLMWAKNIAPDSGAIRLLLIASLLRNERLDEAEKELIGAASVADRSPLYHLLVAETARLSGDQTKIALPLETALNREMALLFRFACESCGSVTEEYAGRCPACGTWNGLNPVEP